LARAAKNRLPIVEFVARKMPDTDPKDIGKVFDQVST